MHNFPRAYEMVSRNVVPVFTAWAGFVLCLCAEMTITTDIYNIIKEGERSAVERI